MADTVDHEAEFDEAFKGFGEDPAPVALPTDPATPPATPGAAAEPPKADPPKPAEEPKKDDEPATPPVEPPKKDEEGTPPADPEKKPEEGAEPPAAPATPPEPKEEKPLTEESLTSIINKVRTEERNSTKEIENTTNEVLEAYYPDGLSNTLVDQTTGKELRTPQDVVDASGGEMTTEQAAQWLMNEQYKLDTEVSRIKNDATKIAETTVNFKRDSINALRKYEPLFKAYPHLQKKSFDLLMKQVKTDKDKGVILAAPDVMDLYDTYLEPYQQAYEYSTKQPATNAVPPVATPPAPVTPGAEDRLDEGGDGGPAPVDDPNNFAQQVTKELAKDI